MTTLTDIQKMVDIIAEKFHPDKVILFGSHTRGESDKNSDVDLLVVMETDKRGPRRTTPLRLLLWGFNTPIDILVRTPAEYERGRARYWDVLSNAAAEGKLLYDATRG